MRALALVVLVLPLIVACTSSDKPERKPRKSTASEAKSPAEPSVPVPDEVEPLTPAGPVPIAEWWCVCYQAESEAGPRPETACRKLESECRDLEKRIASGGRGIVAGSLERSCRRLEGDHPGDATGGRERWKPSKLAGAWTSEGACLLDDAEADEAEADDGGDDEGPFDFLGSEAIGELHMEMPATEVGEILGKPSETGPIEVEGASGDFVQTWGYPDAGVHLNMRASTRRGSQTIGSIRIEAPSKRQTKRGIGIGSSRAEVEKAYGDVEDKEFSEGSTFIAGSIYGGLFFEFEGKVVRSIFMGAGAE